jgi:hypothetical protein
MKRDLTPGRLLVQLVPDMPGGVHDYAQALQQAWADAGQPSELWGLDEAGARSRPLADRLRHIMGSGPQTATLLLHYSCFGFHRHGLGWWLARELASARASIGPRLRVVTMFHELQVVAKPWRRQHWLGRLQARLLERLVRESDEVRTNTDFHRAWLAERLPPGRTVPTYPVFSNVGEPASPPVSDRQPWLIVFGSSPTRARVLAGLPIHAASLHRLGIRRVVEVGTGAEAGKALSSGAGFEFEFVGSLPTAEVSQLLCAARYGFIDYPGVCLAKSGVFAAYAAHGCVVLNTAPLTGQSDGLVAGRHLVDLTTNTVLPTEAAASQRMHEAVRRWYAGHRLNVQAREWLTLGHSTSVDEASHA